MIPFKKITKGGLVLIIYSHAISDQEIQNNGGCPEAAGPDRERLLQPRKYQKYPHRSWLGNWLWALIVKIQGNCYLKYREYLQKIYSLDTWCLTEQTNVLRSDTTSNRINHTACYIWPTMLHISCALNNSSTLQVFQQTCGAQNFSKPFKKHHIYYYANPVYGVATICHQVSWLRWGHPSLFHTATSLLIWYKMFCVRDISYKLIWMEFINMFSVYAQSVVCLSV